MTHHRRRNRSRHGRNDGMRNNSYNSDMYNDSHRGGLAPRDDRSHHDNSRDRGLDANSGPSRQASSNPGKPSDTIILENLPRQIPVEELTHHIRTHHVLRNFSDFEVRMCSTTATRRAFIQFKSVEDCVEFFNDCSPNMPLHIPHPTGQGAGTNHIIYIHFARSREEADGRLRASDGNNWKCAVCNFDNFPSRSICKMCDDPTTRVPRFTGHTDSSPSSSLSQILVVYPLPANVNSITFAAAMEALETQKKPEIPKAPVGEPPRLMSTAPGSDLWKHGARPGSVHRIIILRDARTHAFQSYGFVEYWTVEDANAAVGKFNRLRQGELRIQGCSVTVSDIHMGAFIPEQRVITADTEHLSFHPLFNPHIRVRYKDSRVYPSMFTVNSSAPPPKESPVVNDAKKAKKRKADGVLGTSAKKTGPPIPSQLVKWQRKHEEIRGKDSDAQESSNLQDRIEPFKFSMSAPKKGSAANSKTQQSKSNKNDAGNEAPAQLENTQTYMIGLSCWICLLRFKSLDDASKHLNTTQHKTATKDPKLVEAARPRLAKHAVEAEAAPVMPQYRDRAKERREAHNQPARAPAPAPAPAPGHAQSAPATKADSSSFSSNDEQKAPSAAESSKPARLSKGAGMLAKMGWTSGAGLGANGEGRVDVVATNAYQEGVGLGAEGGDLGDAAQLAERKTTNKASDYLSNVQDKARERLKKMA